MHTGLTAVFFPFFFHNIIQMTITLFGTCRINGIHNNNNLNNLINYTHSTKEVLQQIKFLLGEKTFPSPFDTLCFRTGIIHNKPIIYDSMYHRLFSESNICVIEICSDKKYICDDFFLHHLCVDKRFSSNHQNTPQTIMDRFTCIKQTPTEIENDLLEIKKLLDPKKIIVVTHYNSKRNGVYIESRNNLILLLGDICKKYNIPIIKPSDVLSDYKQEEVMTDDLGHYTSFGIARWSEYMNTAIARILSPPVVTVNIMGGLGNQLFQLAAAYSYAKKEKGTLRILRQTNNGSRPFYWDSMCHALSSHMVETLPSTLASWHEPLPTMYAPLPPLPDGGIHLHGYFQTSAYHVDKDEIRSLFTPPPQWIQSVQEAYHTLLEQSHRIIVLHCRQTDYLTYREIHGPLTIDYYHRAIEKARSWVEDPLFLLCGDDPSFWAPLCAELPSTAYHVLEESSDVRTFLLLQQCKHFIMSNSTFIWWCVYLSSADHVIAPATWFGQKGPSPFHDIYESTWIRMD